MKNRLVAILTLLLLTLAVAPTFAKSPAPKPASEKAAPAAHAQTVTGDLQSVDATAKAITVKVKSANEKFTLAGNAMIMEHGKSIQFSDLKTGDRVEVTFTGTGDNQVASRLYVLSAAKS